jgi:ankyrin repeat protein
MSLGAAAGSTAPDNEKKPSFDLEAKYMRDGGCDEGALLSDSNKKQLQTLRNEKKERSAQELLQNAHTICTLVHFASIEDKLGSLGVMLRELGKKAKLDGQDGLGRNALCEAARNGLETNVSLLLGDEKTGVIANIEAKDGNANTPLCSAVLGKYPLTMVPLLLRRGANSNVRCNHGREHILITALPNPAVVDALLSSKTDQSLTLRELQSFFHRSYPKIDSQIKELRSTLDDIGNKSIQLLKALSRRGEEKKDGPKRVEHRSEDAARVDIRSARAKYERLLALRQSYKSIRASISLSYRHESKLVEANKELYPRGRLRTNKAFASQIRKSRLEGNEVKAQRLINQAHNVNVLVRFAALGDQKAFEQQLKLVEFSDIDSTNSSGLTALGAAAFYGRLEIVKSIFEYKFTPTNFASAWAYKTDDYGNNALCNAVFGGHLEVAKYLVGHGSSVLSTCGMSRGPIVLAALPHPSVLGWLLESGASIDEIDEERLKDQCDGRDNGVTTGKKLYLESCKKMWEALAPYSLFALEQHLSAHAMYNEGAVFDLRRATHFGYIRTRRADLDPRWYLLRMHQVNLAVQAAKKELDSDSKKIFADAKLYQGLDESGVEGTTPLVSACQAGQQNVVKHLLLLDANPNVRDGNDRIPICEAVRKGNVALVRALLAHKGRHATRINVRCDDQNTLLMYAMWLPEVVAMLLERGIDLDFLPNRFYTYEQAYLERFGELHISKPGETDANLNKSYQLIKEQAEGKAARIKIHLDEGKSDEGKHAPEIPVVDLKQRTEVLKQNALYAVVAKNDERTKVAVVYKRPAVLDSKLGSFSRKELIRLRLDSSDFDAYDLDIIWKKRIPSVKSSGNIRTTTPKNKMKFPCMLGKDVTESLCKVWAIFEVENDLKQSFVLLEGPKPRRQLIVRQLRLEQGSMNWKLPL